MKEIEKTTVLAVRIPRDLYKALVKAADLSGEPFVDFLRNRLMASLPNYKRDTRIVDAADKLTGGDDAPSNRI